MNPTATIMAVAAKCTLALIENRANLETAA
jgi:hypothetical protein